MSEPKKPVKRRPAAKKHTVPSLTILQKRFCDIYHSMKKPNKGKAYQLAGYTCKGETARVEAERLIGKDGPKHVKAYLDSLKAAATKRAQRSADEIIAELEKVAFSNVGDYLSFGPKGVILKSSSKLTKAQLAVIDEVNDYFTKQGTRRLRFKLHSKLHALELLGKRHALFPNRQEVTGKDGGAIEHNVSIVHFSKKKK